MELVEYPEHYPVRDIGLSNCPLLMILGCPWMKKTHANRHGESDHTTEAADIAAFIAFLGPNPAASTPDSKAPDAGTVMPPDTLAACTGERQVNCPCDIQM